jgi:hypothetical protein
MEENNPDFTEITKRMMDKLRANLRQRQAADRAYGLKEGFLVLGHDGILSLTSPEDLDIDPETVFEGLEDVVSEINALYGFVD